MYCKKCGNKIKEDDLFCVKCGAKFANFDESTAKDRLPSKIKNEMVSSEENVTVATGKVDKKSLLYATISMLVLSVIFSFTKVFAIGALGVSQKYGLFGTAHSVHTFLVIGYVIAVGFLILPFFGFIKWNKWLFLPAKIITILMALWFLFMILGGMISVEESGFESIANFSLTITGWLLLVSIVASIVLSFKTSAMYCRTTSMEK